ncbi:MAG TPA: choice-of-anchor D domain-containing protein, partial [Candidatus Kapabacteria bacterium]|nr:choice-of-anchor D domain-containing protein [Candidatus Kapabacteria bacterium]
QQRYGGTGDDIARDIELTRDGGFIVAGYSNSTDGDVTGNHGGADAWIVKLDSNGFIQWQDALGGAGEDNAYDIQQTFDGGYIFAGASTSTDAIVGGNHGGSDYWVVKLDTNGGTQWEESLGGSQADFATSIRQTADSGFIVLGNSFSNDSDVTGNHGLSDYWVTKLDHFGAIEWEQSFGGSGNDEPGMIRPTRDGGYIMSGQSFSNDGEVTGNHGLSDFWIVKLEDFPEIFASAEDVGTLLCSDKKDTTVQIFNTGTDILRVDSIVITGTDAAAFKITTFVPFLVPPPDYGTGAKSDSATVGIRFTPQHAGISNATLMVYSNDTAHSPYAIPLTAEKDSAAISTDVQLINFGAVLVCAGDTSIKIHVTNTGNIALDSEALDIRGAGFSLGGANTYTIDSGGSIDIAVHFQPNNNTLYSGKLILYTPCDSLMIPLSGKGVIPVISVSGSDFGSICSGDSTERYLTITNKGDTSVVITSANVSAPFRVDSPAVPFIIPAHDSVLLRGFFTPTADGQYNGTLVLRGEPCNVTDSAELKGQSGTPVLVADTLDFGGVNVGDTVFATMMLHNKGNAALTLTSLPVPAGFTLLTPLPITIDAGDSALVFIEFTPDSATEFGGPVLMSGTPCDVSTLTSIRGQGFAVALLVTDSLNFGNVCVGDTAFGYIVLRDTGSVADTVTSITVSNAFFVRTPLPLTVPAGATDTVTIAFVPTSDVPYASKAVIRGTPDSLFAESHLIGQGAVFAIQAAGVDLGQTQVNVQKDSFIVITNAGASQERVRLRTSPPFSIRDTSVTIGAGASDTIPIHFLPLAAAYDSAQLCISSGAPCNDSLCVMLHGETVQVLRSTTLCVVAPTVTTEGKEEKISFM